MVIDQILPPEKMRKDKVVSKESTALLLEKVIAILEDMEDSSFTKEGVREKVFPFADQEGRGIVLWPMRMALSGREKSPDPFEICDILGKDESILRLKKVVEFLKS